jgi:hypothetical protein
LLAVSRAVRRKRERKGKQRGSNQEFAMIRWLWRRLFPRPTLWHRSLVELRDMESLARSGLAGMLLAQEKARLEYLQARETYERQPNQTSLDRMYNQLHHLQATNAVVQSLIHEQHLEQLIAAGMDRASGEPQPVKSR